MYCSHVNNIDYLLKKHRANAKEIRSVISSLNPEDRVKYDYDLLEEKYVENQNNEVDDESTLETLTKLLKDKEVLLVAPGKSSIDEIDKVKSYIKEHHPVVIGVNAILKQYSYDYRIARLT